MFFRSIAPIACSVMVLSACSQMPSAATDESALSVEEAPNMRRHLPGIAKLRNLAHTIRDKKLPLSLAKPTPNVVGGGTSNPNSGPNGLTWFGGPLLEGPAVYTVFWGTGVPTPVVHGLPGFFSSAFGNTPYAQGYNEYNAGTPYTIGSVTYRGSYTDTSPPPATTAADI